MEFVPCTLDAKILKQFQLSYEYGWMHDNCWWHGVKDKMTSWGCHAIDYHMDGSWYEMVASGLGPVI